MGGQCGREWGYRYFIYKMVRTRQSRVRPNLSFLSHVLSFFLSRSLHYKQFYKRQANVCWPSVHSILCTALYTVPSYKYTKIPRLGFPGVQHVMARAVFRSNLSKTVNLDVLYCMLLEISRRLQSIPWPLVHFLVGYVIL